MQTFKIHNPKSPQNQDAVRLEDNHIALSNLISAFPSFAYLEVSLSDKFLQSHLVANVEGGKTNISRHGIRFAQGSPSMSNTCNEFAVTSVFHMCPMSANWHVVQIDVFFSMA